MAKIMKNKKVMFAVVCFIFLGLLPLGLKGIDYGMDFSGGTLIQVNLDITENETVDSQTIVNVLQNRINAYGTKDVSVKPWGDPPEYIVVEIAETDPEIVNEIESIIGEQGRFETLYEGKVILTGEDVISVVVNPQEGYGYRQSGQGFEWSVPFLLSSEASRSFAESVKGECSTPQLQTCPEMVYMFIDRPQNAVILIPNSLANEEGNIPEDLKTSESTIKITELVANSGADLIISSEITDDVLNQIKGKTVVIPPDTYDVSLLTTASNVLVKEKTGDYWIVSALNIDNIVHLTPGVTTGTPITQPSITGHTTTPEEAFDEMNRVVILLKSGKLPVAVSIGSVSTISPTLGGEFLVYSIIAGIVAMFVVTICMFVRYRRPKIALPIMTTLVFEVTMILGVYSLIGQQMDLAAVAGIVAALGTGIDDQIIIVDEVLRKEGEEDRLMSIASKIKRAFSIVFMSAGTLIFAMLPLLFMGLGILKGFAITTILGVIIGVFITRPAYAVIVDRLLK